MKSRANEEDDKLKSGANEEQKKSKKQCGFM
jgi:hypothetical protein